MSAGQQMPPWLQEQIAKMQQSTTAAIQQMQQSTNVNIQNAAQTLQASIQDYTLELQKFQADIGLYQADITKDLQKFNLEKFSIKNWQNLGMKEILNLLTNKKYEIYF